MVLQLRRQLIPLSKLFIQIHQPFAVFRHQPTIIVFGRLALLQQADGVVRLSDVQETLDTQLADGGIACVTL